MDWKSVLGVPLALILAAPGAVMGCTSILVTRGASDNGSTMITYSCDGEFLPHLRYRPARDHDSSEVIEIRGRDGKVCGTIPQVSHTYAVVGLINEHQVAIGETTFEGRKELQNPEGLLHYWTLMSLALQRAATARQAIEVITGLADRYGYASTGESFSIADPGEAWILEMVGPGRGGHGAVWVARKLPDGFISCHANRSRIGRFPMDDPHTCLYSANVVSFAVEHGYWDPSSGQPFRFNEAYDPASAQHIRYSDMRVWSVFRRAAPSLHLSPEYARGMGKGEAYPLWIRPDSRLGTAAVMALMRDHYEGTPYDMTKGLTAGPFGSPNRWRPIGWKVAGRQYAWERPISTQQTGFSFVSQSRKDLPDPVGGVLWYGMDDTYTTCYVPLYCGIDRLPEPYTVGRMDHFSLDSAWWVFNFVANIANLKYSYMIEDIQKVQKDLEGTALALQPAVERTALDLLKNDPVLAVRYLTDYSVSRGEATVRRWRQLGEELMTRYNDGYVQDGNGRPQEVGYPEDWRLRVVKERGKQHALPEGGINEP